VLAVPTTILTARLPRWLQWGPMQTLVPMLVQVPVLLLL
jgi:hypothetical protein